MVDFNGVKVTVSPTKPLVTFRVSKIKAVVIEEQPKVRKIEVELIL